MKAKKYTKETILTLGIEPRKFDKFIVGDAVAVAQRIKEGDRERIQIFEGDVIAIHQNGVSSTFTVRRISANAVAVERVFPFYSPLIPWVKRFGPSWLFFFSITMTSADFCKAFCRYCYRH